MHPTAALDEDQDDLGVDYAFLRKMVGIIALGLPVAVELFKGFLDGHWAVQGSISSYYYTHGRNWFVGTLCALAVFFFSYHHRADGKYRLDNLLTTLAAVTALGVAFFPTTRTADANIADEVVGIVHLVSAATLFALLGTLAFFVFTRTDGTTTPQKIARNRVYRICGSVIYACIGLLLLAEVVHAPREWHILFWLESVMVWAFAVSWLVKGSLGGILADPATASG